MVEAADVGQSNDASVLGWLDGARLGCILLEREMRPRVVVVAEIAAQTTAEMSLAQDDHVVEKLAADRADHSLGEGVLPGGARRREDLDEANSSHSLSEQFAVGAIAIAQEVPRCRVIGECLDDLLRSPGGRWGLSDVEVHDPAAMMQQDHEHVEHAKRRRRYDEEIDGHEVGEVVLQESAPGLRGRLGSARHETC